ncbi:MAG: FAD-dependent oxidoreductase [Proteobacteria bacterium]|nr:FAD-dependent oxidoreductase [Pseudomonadota bacterium]MBS0461462.1 FAD-dependent oxidoreductase [Pseudomonadota bacterium]MBS0464292.1 FAD-dependent oxidoreductase [Pseudomonadota bacterium]
MRIAVVGGGISGLGAAWLISKDPDHQVTLFEREERLGGHVDTQRVQVGGQEYDVDMGFSAYTDENFPLFKRLLDELHVKSQPVHMGLSVLDGRSGMEYNASSVGSLLARPRNLLDQKFLLMLAEIKRFHKEAPHLLEGEGAGPTLGEYLREQKYSSMFVDNHIVPLVGALWLAPVAHVMALPGKYVVRFLRSHKMLRDGKHLQWRSIVGGSARYVEAMRKDWKVAERLNTPVLRITRDDDAVRIASKHGEERFDQVILACHSDQALRLLADPSEMETRLLGAMRYQENEAVLHTDARLLPRKKRAWGAWNAYVAPQASDQCTLSYCMNILQKLDSPEPLIVTLNRTAEIDPAKILARKSLHHPVYDRQSIDAQHQRVKINGQRRTWFSGAYWRYGFHEDGLRTAVSVAKAMDVEWHHH